MKENVLDVLMFLFEKYFYDEPEQEPDRADMEANLHEAGFTNAEIDRRQPTQKPCSSRRQILMQGESVAAASGVLMAVFVP